VPVRAPPSVAARASFAHLRLRPLARRPRAPPPVCSRPRVRARLHPSAAVRPPATAHRRFSSATSGLGFGVSIACRGPGDPVRASAYGRAHCGKRGPVFSFGGRASSLLAVPPHLLPSSPASASTATSYRIYGKADDDFAISVREGVLCFLDTLVMSSADEALEHMLVNVPKENMGHRWPEQQPRHHLRRGIPSASLLQLPPPTTARGRAVLEGWSSVMASGAGLGPMRYCSA